MHIYISTYFWCHQTQAHTLHQLRHILFAIFWVVIDPFDAQLPYMVLLACIQLIVANNVVEIL